MSRRCTAIREAAHLCSEMLRSRRRRPHCLPARNCFSAALRAEKSDADQFGSPDGHDGNNYQCPGYALKDPLFEAILFIHRYSSSSLRTALQRIKHRLFKSSSTVSYAVATLVFSISTHMCKVNHNRQKPRENRHTQALRGCRSRLILPFDALRHTHILGAYHLKICEVWFTVYV